MKDKLKANLTLYLLLHTTIETKTSSNSNKRPRLPLQSGIQTNIAGEDCEEEED